MKIEQIREFRVTATVSGLDPVIDEFLSKPVNPEEVTIVYWPKSGRRQVKVGGYQVKKDGTPGKVWSTAVFSGYYKGPEQINELVQQLAPEGWVPK